MDLFGILTWLNVRLLALGLSLFVVTYPRRLSPKSPTGRNVWRMSIVALALAGLLIVLDIHDNTTRLVSFLGLAGFYAVLHVVTYPVSWGRLAVSLTLIAVAYTAALYVMPLIVLQEVSDVPVKYAFLPVVVVLCLLCTYTPLGRWAWERCNPGL